MFRRAVTLWLWPAIALMAALFVRTGLAGEADKKDEAGLKLDGVWTGFAVEGKGETPDRGPVHLKLTIKGDHVDAERLDGQKLPMNEGTYKITPGTPMQMDGTETNARGRARAYLGIAELNGDTLKWCVATPNNPRPTEFETKRPSFLVILKRQKQ
ncbi:MAG TPA: TIGR03067 domain-containing protein [Planctomycetota bacterium]|nr:TIGR03067 domain-containing protein [Planctomycetota bacterium]